MHSCIEYWPTQIKTAVKRLKALFIFRFWLSHSLELLPFFLKTH